MQARPQATPAYGRLGEFLRGNEIAVAQAVSTSLWNSQTADCSGWDRMAGRPRPGLFVDSRYLPEAVLGGTPPGDCFRL